MQIKRKTYPMPKISEMLLNIEGFKYAMSLDLNMRFYNIWLREDASNICTIVILWGKYWHKCLLMGVINPPDIFQEKMNDQFQGFEFTGANIEKILILTKGDWNAHLKKIELTPTKLK